MPDEYNSLIAFLIIYGYILVDNLRPPKRVDYCSKSTEGQGNNRRLKGELAEEMGYYQYDYWEWEIQGNEELEGLILEIIKERNRLRNLKSQDVCQNPDQGPAIE